MSTRTNKRSRRKPPYPNSVLDRKALLQALDAKGLTLKPVHVTAFYQLLHRQHYPDLPQFVENYYRHEQDYIAQNNSDNNNNNNNNNDDNNIPLKNAVSNKKNRNKVQLPRQFLQFLQQHDCGLVTVTSTVVEEKTSADQTTTKLAVKLSDGQLVESVLMRYVAPPPEYGAAISRASLCVSSQCGCAMGCTFCATGTMGLAGNLSTGEILEQIVHANRILAREWKDRKRNGENHALRANSTKRDEPLNLDMISNVVFMGMGEPLDNYDNVVEACRALIDRKRWSLAHGKVTVSTVGIISRIRKLTADLPEVSLALSLHAPNQEMRSAIVPTAKNYPIEELIDALDAHMMAYARKRLPAGTVFSSEQRIQESSRRRAMIEYVMLEGPTSSLESAHELGKLCEKRQLIVNLIPYNQTDVKDKLKCPPEERIEEFRNIVASYGTLCTIRRTMGADIDSACGQLISLKNKNKNEQNNAVRDIEDMGSGGNDKKPTIMVTTSSSMKESSRKDSSKEETASPDLEQWVRPLVAATMISASCFVVSTYLFLKSRRR